MHLCRRVWYSEYSVPGVPAGGRPNLLKLRTAELLDDLRHSTLPCTPRPKLQQPTTHFTARTALRGPTGTGVPWQRGPLGRLQRQPAGAAAPSGRCSPSATIWSRMCGSSSSGMSASAASTDDSDVDVLGAAVRSR